MRSATKLSLGSIFAIFGAAGIIFIPLLGFSELTPPWSFILGFIFGVMAGVGVALSISGLLEKRNEPLGDLNVRKK
ncbi:hypothetical protein ACFLT2_07555 [Acidobacteriota bacterium]